MADPRFFNRAGPFTLGRVAELARAEISEGADPESVLIDVAPIATAGPGDVCFLDNPRYLPDFGACRAGACIVDPRHAGRAPAGLALLLTERPYGAYARVAQAFYPPGESGAGVHETAVVDPSATLGEGASLGPFALIGPGVEIGARCRIAAHAVVEAGVVIGDDTVVGPGASLSHCLIGQHCELHAGVRIGNRGFGFAVDEADYVDVPQLGRVVIEDGVEVGANTTIDRGTGPDTVIGAGSKIDNLVQIGHNVRIGRGCVLVAQSGIAGSTEFEDRVMLAAQAGVAGHLTVGAGARIGAKSGVMRDVPAGHTLFGYPAMPIRKYFRLVVLWQKQLRSRGKTNE